MTELPVVVVSGFLGPRIREALERETALVETMRGLGAAIVLFECGFIDETEDVGARIERDLLAADAALPSTIRWPIFVVEMSLPDLVSRRPRGVGWDQVHPFRVRPARGVFGGALLIGEGGLAYAHADGRITGTSAALEELRAIVQARAATGAR